MKTVDGAGRRPDRSRHRASRPRRGIVAILVRLTTALAMLGVMLAAGMTPAAAAGGTLNMSMEAVSASVDSGQGASFRVQWTCSGSGGGGAAGTCDNAKISIPVPTAQPGSAAYPGGIPLTVTSQSSLQIGGTTVPGAAQIVGTAPNQTLEWTFPATVATGTSGTVSFTLLPPNAITPDGSTISPVATFTATGAESRTATATTTVNADVSLKVRKQKLTPTDVPYVDQQVTYAILAGYESQISDTGPIQYTRRMDQVCAENGTQALENIVVVDTLPAGAQFVSANFGGTYNAAANTITWNLGSSIDDVTKACRPFSGGTAWVGSSLQATVVYPSPTFTAAPDPAVENNVKVTANPWGQPGIELSDTDAVTHGLREGSSGASVAKAPGADWAVGAPLYRTVDSGSSNLYYLTGTSGSAQPGRWRAVDVLPCGLTSPTNPNSTNCSTPAYTNIRFSADQFLPAVDINWTTNAGTTGVCRLPAGSSMSDTAKRYCGGGTATTPVAGVPAGEWITKFEFDTPIPAYGGGHIYIHGTPSPNIPSTNLDTVYTQFPTPGNDRSDVHPWYVTVENCTAVNEIELANGRIYTPATPQLPSSNGGPCGYRQIMANPVNLRPVKSMYDPSIPVAERPATPSVQTGDELTVDLQIRRDSWPASPAVLSTATMTPTITEYLPASLTMVPDSLVMAGDANFRSALGAPVVETSTVTFGGETRTQVKVTFPDANITSAATLNRAAFVRFQVRVVDGTPAGAYTNDYLVQAEEAGPGVGGTYLNCQTGTMVDADLRPTTDRSVAIGCLASTRYNVLPVPGITTSKTVQGVYDDEEIPAPGIGRTDVGGEADYVVTVRNTGSVDIRNVVAYDLLPRIGDTDILPGSTGARGSEFPVRLTGPVAAPGSATVQYSTSLNPCRGELAGTGGGTTASAPAGCSNDWSATPPGGDYSAVTGIRLDFGSRVFSAGEAASTTLEVRAAGPNVTTGAALDGVAWNNTAVAGREASSNSAILPTEASKVGLRLMPDLTWNKRDGDTGDLLGGSVWTLTPAGGDPITVADCTAAPCTGPDTDPAAGRFHLEGLAWGEYSLEETTAPSGGYLPLDEPIDVSLTPANVDRATYELDLGRQLNYLPEGEWTSSKSSDPESGTTVVAGQTVTYTITASNDSEYPARDVSLTDDLTEVLDDASFDSIIEDDGGRATRTGDTIVWNVGTLEPGETRTVRYSVTVLPDGQRGDNRLGNVLAPTGTDNPDCEDETVSCTEHPVPELASWKQVEADETPVRAGTVLTYTLFFENSGEAPAIVDEVDDLTHVTDDADVTTEPTSADGLTVSRTGNRISIGGEVPAGETYTVTYQVTVKPDAERGDDIAANFLLPPDEEPPTEPVCQPTDQERPDCTVTPVGRLLTSKSVSADPTPVDTGSVLTYTLTFDNQGRGPVTVDKTDHLDDVLDDAVLTSDPVSSDPALTVSGVVDGAFSITGELAAGQTVTVTYQVTVKPEADRGNNTADNFLVPTGEEPPEVCEDDDANCTVTPLPLIEVDKTSDPETGTAVEPGQEVTYTLTFTNSGQAPGDVDFTDHLAAVLDDADLTGAPVSSDPALVTTDGADGLVRVTGTLQPGQTVTVKYTVTVKEAAERGDSILRNVVADTSVTEPECEDAGVICTEHPVDEFELSKSVDPEHGTTVTAGQTLTYTLTFRNLGGRPVPVDWTDHLGDVLDDATLVSAPAVDGDAHGLTVSPVTGQAFTVSGDQDALSTVTVTYQVKVKAKGRGDSVLTNFLMEDDETPPNGPCDPEQEICTENPVGEFSVVKSSDPASGTTVEEGDVVKYTLTFKNTGGAKQRVDYTDHLGELLDDATVIRDPRIAGAAHGLAVSPIANEAFTVSGDMDGNSTVRVVYSVKVLTSGSGDGSLLNVVTETGDEPPAECVADNPLCTEHPVEPPPHEPGDPGDPGDDGFLPNTGGPALLILLAGIALTAAGWLLMRRRGGERVVAHRR